MDVGGKQLFSVALDGDWQYLGLCDDSVNVAGGSLISCSRHYLLGTNSSLPPICVSVNYIFGKYGPMMNVWEILLMKDKCGPSG